MWIRIIQGIGGAAFLFWGIRAIAVLPRGGAGFSTAVGMAFPAVIMCAFCGVCGGCLLASALLPGVARKFTDFLFGGRKFLKKAPPVLSVLRGLIDREDFQAAAAELEKLEETYPHHASVCLLGAELLAKTTGPEAAVAYILKYFADEKSPAEGEEAPLFLLLTDLVLENGLKAQYSALLLSLLERRKRTLSARQYQDIAERMK